MKMLNPIEIVRLPNVQAYAKALGLASVKELSPDQLTAWVASGKVDAGFEYAYNTMRELDDEDINKASAYDIVREALEKGRSVQCVLVQNESAAGKMLVKTGWVFHLA